MSAEPPAGAEQRHPDGSMHHEQRPPRPPTPATNRISAAIFIGLGIEILTGAWRSAAVLRALGATLPIEMLQATGQYWRLVTSMFLHGNGTIAGTLLHFLLNLVALRSFASIYEEMFGTRRFLFIYCGAGLTASLASAYNLEPWGSSVGASGAIAGIVGAMVPSILRSPRYRHDPKQRRLAGETVFWILANVALALEMENVETDIQLDHAAHVGGLLMGVLLGAVLPHRPGPPPDARTAVIDVQPGVIDVQPGVIDVQPGVIDGQPDVIDVQRRDD